MPDNPTLYRTWATLRLGGKDLDPNYVTDRLGIDPSDSHRRGEPHGKPGQVWRMGYWSLTSEGQPIPTDLEDHISWVLDQIEPAREQFVALRTGDVRADIFCFLDCYGGGGPELSPVLLGRLASLSLPLGLDIYFADREDEAD